MKSVHIRQILLRLDTRDPDHRFVLRLYDETIPSRKQDLLRSLLVSGANGTVPETQRRTPFIQQMHRMEDVDSAPSVTEQPEIRIGKVFGDQGDA